MSHKVSTKKVNEMLNELITVIGDILTCPKPQPDVLGPKDIERILKRIIKSN